ncbi:MAG: STAS/SEC14 domain-containing protein [Rhizobiaceae bacterium]|nr:STAS/SEC14 domain-containing protein [Rhizobiaceae bacterium]
MNAIEPVPAVRRIDTDKPDVYAFEIAGRILGSDAENLYGLLEGAYALHEQIDVLVKLVDHDGVDWDEVSRETLDSGRERALARVRRCAAVGEPDWTGSLTGFFAPKLAVEIRHFGEGEEEAAWAWLGARALPEDV